MCSKHTPDLPLSLPPHTHAHTFTHTLQSSICVSCSSLSSPVGATFLRPPLHWRFVFAFLFPLHTFSQQIIKSGNDGGAQDEGGRLGFRRVGRTAQPPTTRTTQCTQQRRRVSSLPGHSSSQLFVDWRRVRAAFFPIAERLLLFVSG